MKNDVGQLFQRTLPDSEPPMGFSGDDVVAAGRRRRNRRRFAVSGGGLVAVAAVAALSLLLVPGAATPAPDGGADQNRLGAADDPKDGNEKGSKEDRDKFALHIAKIVDQQDEDVTVKPHRSDDFELGFFDDETGNWETGGSDHYELSILVYDTEGDFRGQLTIGLHAPGTFDDKPLEVKAGQAPEGTLIHCAKAQCVKSTTPDGGTLYTQAGVNAQRDIVEDNSVVFRADGTAVTASNACGNLGSDGDGGQLYCEKSLLTVDDLAAIVTDVPETLPIFGK